MCRLKAIFEIGECLHVPPRALARGDIGHVQRAQVADSAREETLGGAHQEERDVRNIVPDARRDATRLIEEERGEIDVRQDELDARDILIETRALRREETQAATTFIPRERYEPRSKYNRRKDEDQVPHV